MIVLQPCVSARLCTCVFLLGVCLVYACVCACLHAADVYLEASPTLVSLKGVGEFESSPFLLYPLGSSCLPTCYEQSDHHTLFHCFYNLWAAQRVAWHRCMHCTGAPVCRVCFGMYVFGALLHDAVAGVPLCFGGGGVGTSKADTGRIHERAKFMRPPALCTTT
jgi:hypothetical protein